MKYYKLLDENDKGRYSRFKWDTSGNWMAVTGPLEMCKNGFHVLRLSDIRMWLECGFNLYEVETSGDRTESEDKICVRSVRVVKKVESYNKSALLELVIRPAVKRAKKHAAYAATTCAVRTAAYAAADDAADAASDAATAVIDAAAAAADAAAYAVEAAARAAAYAARAAVYAARADAADAERRFQTKDIKKIIERDN